MERRNLHRAAIRVGRVAQVGRLGWGASVGLALLTLIALTGCASNNQQSPAATATATSPQTADQPADEETPEPVASPEDETESLEASPSPEPVVYWPQQIEIPAINVKAPVVHVGLEPDGAMEAPKGPDIIGWYTGSVAPGMQGNALVTAHVDWLDRTTGQSRTAVFWDLDKLKQGDQVIVHAEENQQFSYVVKDSVLVKFDDPDALKYVEPTETSILTMITCEGNFDQSSRNYDMRRIVVADLQ